jgi:periplasmic divalent cation tolerance protein
VSFFFALSTAGSEKEGHRIGKILVEKGLAACVNVIPGITSFFFWEGKLCKDKEVMLLIKTTERNLKEIADNIIKIHSYSVPEILFVKIEKGDKKYLDWIRETVEKGRKKRIKKLLTEVIEKR